LKTPLLILLLITVGYTAKSQTIDSLFFNLYTDSLKKGTHNYINVDAKYNNGRYLPLTTTQLDFKASAGTFEGNSLIIPLDIKVDSITITVTLKQNKSIQKQITLYLKKKPDNEVLKTTDEILNGIKKKEKRKS
jgi:hypothetical protein